MATADKAWPQGLQPIKLPARLARWTRALISSMTACVLAVSWHAASQAAAPTAADFARLPEIDAVVLSPSGQRMAFIIVGDDGWRRLAVLDLAPLGGMRVIGGFANADVTHVAWVNDDRLVYEAYARAAEIKVDEGGTFAVDHDGRDQRRLISWRPEVLNRSAASRIQTRTLPYGWFLHSAPDDGSGEILVQRRIDDGVGDLREVHLARLNAQDGSMKSLSFGVPDGTRRWWLDAKHQPRVVVAVRKGREYLYWRAPGSDDWQLVHEQDPLAAGGFDPWQLDGDASLLVLGRLAGEFQAVFRFDLAKRKLNLEPVVQVAGYDLSPVAETDARSGRLLGLHFTADRRASHWFDPTLARLQQSLDLSLPKGRVNVIHCGRCESTRFFVIHSSSDRNPGEYWLFDREKVSLSPIGPARPWIDEKSQGSRSLHKVAARDGLSLPLYVTQPAAAAGPADKRPAVLLVHGGPWARGADLGWAKLPQFLASRGFVVLEPEFRGSTGYGGRLFTAGWREWGRRMQDDLVDATRFAAEQGWIDPQKVCIVGASYGGYAALMAPIVTPGVFRCASSFAGVTDIDLMYSTHWSDTSEQSKRHSMPVLIGDPVADADRLKAASPLRRVAEIKVPVQLLHGGADRRVPQVHADSFVTAAKAAGIEIESHIYADEGHGFYRHPNEADYFERLDAFLQRHLKPR